MAIAAWPQTLRKITPMPIPEYSWKNSRLPTARPEHRSTHAQHSLARRLLRDVAAMGAKGDAGSSGNHSNKLLGGGGILPCMLFQPAQLTVLEEVPALLLPEFDPEWSSLQNLQRPATVMLSSTSWQRPRTPRYFRLSSPNSTHRPELVKLEVKGKPPPLACDLVLPSANSSSWPLNRPFSKSSRRPASQPCSKSPRKASLPKRWLL
eukprot:TRINITY_DN91938_c0_g1_i1.p1 TRINITY_DN91938_c0_g1~~TRINITY_DN91938_c0_g1_i1.p1  ORF type:complete len:216 (-),score=24.42 TRINITY_DN91938_c0_g1_i1:73-693(-)